MREYASRPVYTSPAKAKSAGLEFLEVNVSLKSANRASNEYFKVVDKKNLKGHLIHPVFKDYKNGKLKTISFYAKKARGAMARYLIEQKNTDLKSILKFNEDGYAYSESDSKDKNHPTFIR